MVERSALDWSDGPVSLWQNNPALSSICPWGMFPNLIWDVRKTQKHKLDEDNHQRVFHTLHVTFYSVLRSRSKLLIWLVSDKSGSWITWHFSLVLLVKCLFYYVLSRYLDDTSWPMKGHASHFITRPTHYPLRLLGDWLLPTWLLVGGIRVAPSRHITHPGPSFRMFPLIW